MKVAFLWAVQQIYLLFLHKDNTPLYKKGIKKPQIKSLETTN